MAKNGFEAEATVNIIRSFMLIYFSSKLCSKFAKNKF